MKAARNILFVKYGSFSHVNAPMADALAREFPEYRLTVVDAARDILASYAWLSLFLRLAANMRSPVAFFRGRHSPWDFVFREAAAWDLISRWMTRHADPENTAFIFQTQSMFDASSPPIPSFVYTDHTREAHRRQGAGGAVAPASREWIERERALYRRADTVFTLSDFCRRSVVEDYDVAPDKVLTVSTGINMHLPGGPVDAGSRRPVILFVGGEWKVKGGPYLVEAFRLVRREIPDVELWLVGSQPARLEPGLKAHGRVDRGTLDRLYREAAVLCVPSILDRASMVALDAAAYGLPVVTNPFGAGAERVVDGVTGYVVDPRDPAALSSVLIRLLRDPALRRTLGSAGRDRVEKEFTWETVGAKVADRIRSVLHAEKS
jgi:glycosyltransferase involved in cell wall biosynthesis